MPVIWVKLKSAYWVQLVLFVSVVAVLCRESNGSNSRKVVSRNNGGISSSTETSVNNPQRKTCSFTNGLHANLIRFITKDGFHRDLGDSLEVTVTSSTIPIAHFVKGECSFVIYNEFTQDIYVDPYEIDRNPELNGLIRVVNNWTDLENPAWLATANSTVFVQVKTIQTGNLISSEEVKMPIHFRYQKPISHSIARIIRGSDRYEEHASSVGFQSVGLPLPKILLRCSYWNSRLVQDLCDSVKTVCSVTSSKTKQCTWAVVPFNANSKGSTVYIPVGDSDLQVLITYSTFLVIVGGTTFLLVTLVRARNEHAAIKSHAH